VFLADIARRFPHVAGPRRAVLEGGLIPSRTFELVRRMAGCDLRLTFGGFTHPTWEFTACYRDVNCHAVTIRGKSQYRTDKSI